MWYPDSSATFGCTINVDSRVRGYDNESRGTEKPTLSKEGESTPAMA